MLIVYAISVFNNVSVLKVLALACILRFGWWISVLPHARPAPVQEEDEGGREYDVRDDRESVRDCHEPLIG